MTQPPIVPGPQPYDPQHGWAPPPYILPAAPKRRGWVLPVQIAAGAAVILAALAVSAMLLLPRFAGPAKTALRTAYEVCGQRGELSDSDHTLFLDMAGSKAGSGDLTAGQIGCYFEQLKMPDYIIREMGQTTALNGRQSDSWGDFSASWTYHPDDGLDVLIRQVKG